ncbi:MAG: hypothetical protein IIB03_06045 [Acidobacteria bacterium]|nr:hypothetical protein [Acidobacteriota bacterium]
MLAEQTVWILAILTVVSLGSVYAMGLFRGAMRNGLIACFSGGLIFYLVEAFHYIRFYW